MPSSPIPEPILNLLEKYGHPADKLEPDQASDEADIKILIGELNSLGSQLGLAKVYVYHDFKHALATLITLRQKYIKRTTVFQTLFNDGPRSISISCVEIWLP